MKATLLEIDLHNAIRQQDELALSKLYFMYGEQIVSLLKYLFQEAAAKDEADIYQAVNDAFLGYYRNPDTFNPKLGSLLAFLRVAAKRDMLNIISGQKKHLSREKLPPNVELQENFWNRITESDYCTDAAIITEETLEQIDKLFRRHFRTDMDIALAKMIISGERKTELYSEVLGMEGLGIEEQTASVRKHKDRIKQVLKRHNVEAEIKKLIP
jgi:DNA-directed RNA polymerase specialized sigma24 family protein